MKKVLLIIYLVMSAFSILAAQDLSGTWEGTLTQDESDISGGEYTFKIFIQVDKNGNVRGTAYVKADALNIYAVMQLKGKFDGKYMKIEEDEIIRQERIEDVSWCLKYYTLKFTSDSTHRLEGKWQGYTNTGPCIPGKIYLTKSVPRV